MKTAASEVKRTVKLDSGKNINNKKMRTKFQSQEQVCRKGDSSGGGGCGTGCCRAALNGTSDSNKWLVDDGKNKKTL